MTHQILDPKINTNIELTIKNLYNGIPISFPTETVYGLGGNAYDDRAVANIFIYKNRPKFNPINVCYKNIEDSTRDLILTKDALKISELLPGPITIVLEKKENSKLSKLCSKGLNSIGVRIPNNEVALKLLSAIPFPLATPSANKSGNLSPVSARSVSENFEDINDLIILDGGRCKVGMESTIIDCSQKIPYVVRYGAISLEEIEDRCKVKIYSRICDTCEVKKYRYTKPVILNVISGCFPNDALLAFGKTFDNECKLVLNLSPSGDINEAAANFFQFFEILIKSECDRICVMPIPDSGIGVAINDRLKKAAKNI